MTYVYISAFIAVIFAIVGYGLWITCNLDYLLQWADDVSKYKISPRWKITKMCFDDSDFLPYMRGKHSIFWWGAMIFVIPVLSAILGFIWPISLIGGFFFLLREWKRLKKKLQKLSDIEKKEEKSE